MPENSPSPASPMPPGVNPSPAGGPSGQPPAPFGSSPATGPTQNRGYEMAGMQKLGLALQILETSLPMLGAASEGGQAVIKAIGLLAKHVQPGMNSPASQGNQIQELMRRNMQQGQQAAMLRQQGGAGGPPGGGAPPSPMQPPGGGGAPPPGMGA